MNGKNMKLLGDQSTFKDPATIGQYLYI